MTHGLCWFESELLAILVHNAVLDDDGGSVLLGDSVLLSGHIVSKKRILNACLPSLKLAYLLEVCKDVGGGANYIDFSTKDK